MDIFRRRSVLGILLLLLVSCQNVIVECSIAASERKEILQELLDESVYDAQVPPTYAMENPVPTDVTVQFYVTNIHNVQENNMDYQMDIFFRQKWVDHRLRHNSSDDVLEVASASMHKVWVPDTYFDNAKSGYLHVVTVPNKMLHISQDGSVLYSIHLNLKLTCAMNLSKYPLEEQFCPIQLSSYSYSASVVNYIWNPDGAGVISKNIQMAQFEYSKTVQSGRCDTYYEGVGKFSCLIAHVHLTRKLGYFIIQLFVPSILVVALSWVSFWIDHESVPARISLGLLTVLTITTQSSSFQKVFPNVSYVKAADLWLASCLMFVFLGLLQYAYVNKLSRSTKKHTEQSLEPQALAKNTSESDTSSLQSAYRAANRVDRVSRYLFPIAFLLFNVAFWVYYLMS